MARAVEITVEPLGGDVVEMAQCMVIDAEAFPYASAHFGLRAASARVWVAREAGAPAVVGFAAGRERRGVLQLEGVAVAREHRRRGIGRALLREAVARARERRLRAVVLHVSVTNRGALALYDAEGFVVRRRLRGFYPPSAFGGERDAYEMVLALAG